MAKKKTAEKPTDEEDLNDEAVLDGESAEVIPVVDVPPTAEALLPMRDWRDVERLREIRDLKKLVDEDLDFDSLFPPKPLPTVKPLKPAKPVKAAKAAKAAAELAAATPAPAAKSAAATKPVKVKSTPPASASKKAAKTPAKPKKSGGLMKALKKVLKPKSKPVPKKKKR